MAQTDFEITTSGDGTLIVPAGGLEGTSVQHDLLSNPLTGYGDLGRQYRYEIVAPGNTTSILSTVSSSVDGGIWVGTPITYSLSVRAALRISSVGSGSKMSGISAKTGVFSTGSDKALASGYHLHLGRYNVFASSGGENELSLLMVSENPNNFTDTKRVFIPTLGSYTSGNWYLVRMDVTPSGSSEDTIEIYTSPIADPGSEVWSLVHTETVLSSDAHYTPWGDSNSNKVGYIQCVTNTFAVEFVTGMIDNFRVSRTEV